MPLNTKPKYVASRTLAEPLAWQNSTVLQDDVGGAVAALKQEDGQDLDVIGSSELVQTLVAHDLVDEFRVMIDPVVVGGGKRLFRPHCPTVSLCGAARWTCGLASRGCAVHDEVMEGSSRC